MKMQLGTALSILRRIKSAMVIVVTLPSVLPLVFTDVICPNPCWCDDIDGKLVTVCWDHNITQVPQNFDKRVQEIALMFNNITVIKDYVFYGLSNVSVLIIQYNKIRELREQAFDGLYNLIYLDLSHNNIVTIPSKVILNNEKLKFLYFSHNEITVSGPFLISTSLSVLDISFCKLTFLPHDAFTGLPNLTKLKINDNKITEFEIYAFRGLKRLETLIAGNNVIKRLYSILFDELDELRYVDLSNNSISQVPSRLFVHNLKLRYLFLGNNNVSFHNSGPFLVSQSLSHLDISFCDITSIPPDAFIDLSNLTTLRMVGNPLKKLEIETMQPLKKLQVILLDAGNNCSESSFQNVFEYFQEHYIAYYAPPLCITEKTVTESTFIYEPTTITSSQNPHITVINVTVQSTHSPALNNSTQKIFSEVFHGNILYIMTVLCIFFVFR